LKEARDHPRASGEIKAQASAQLQQLQCS